MPTVKQLLANQRNAQHSTGPKTVAGKEASAGNAVTHGITSKKYLVHGEDPGEFEARYVARRKLHLPDDPIIDHLVSRITLIHNRLDRGFRTEAEMIDEESLKDLLVCLPDNRLKNLLAYEAANRKTLKVLEEELARYEEMVKEQREATNPSAAPSTAATSLGQETTSPTSAAEESLATPTSSSAAPEENPKTNPISNPSVVAVAPGAGLSGATAGAEIGAPARQPVQTVSAAPSRPASGHDISNWGRSR